MFFHKKKLTYVLIGVAASIVILFTTSLAGYLHYKILFLMYGKECGFRSLPNCNDSHPILGPVMIDREAQHGAGAVTYGFKKLVIYYTHFTHPDEQKAQDYPELLKFENFDALLIDTIKKKFVCLTEKSGAMKPIVSYGDTRNRRSKYFETEIAAAKEDATNPDNLVIFLQVDYSLYPDWPKDEKPYARMMYNIYRPGLTGWEAVLPFINNSRSAIVYPSDGEQALRKRLELFFGWMSPSYCRPPFKGPTSAITP